jgi:hypothetical protein
MLTVVLLRKLSENIHSENKIETGTALTWIQKNASYTGNLRDTRKWLRIVPKGRL